MPVQSVQKIRPRVVAVGETTENRAFGFQPTGSEQLKVTISDRVRALNKDKVDGFIQPKDLDRKSVV